MTTPTIIDGLDGFRALQGQTIGTSSPVLVTQDMIEGFCTAVGNTEWIHWDQERCRQSSFGTTIAPGLLAQSFFSKLWFDMVDIRGIPRMLFLGSDRVRLIAPLKCGDTFTMTTAVARVEERDNGIAVFLDLQWHANGGSQPFCIATFILRYMND